VRLLSVDLGFKIDNTVAMSLDCTRARAEVRSIWIGQPRDALAFIGLFPRLAADHDLACIDVTGNTRDVDDVRRLLPHSPAWAETPIYLLKIVPSYRKIKQLETGIVTVGKRLVVLALTSAIEGGRLVCVPGVAGASTFRAELLVFRSWADDTGLVRYGAPRKCHDDTVSAAAQGLWLAEYLLRSGALGRFVPSNPVAVSEEVFR
jgi:hypothetical protein